MLLARSRHPLIGSEFHAQRFMSTYITHESTSLNLMNDETSEPTRHLWWRELKTDAIQSKHLVFICPLVLLCVKTDQGTTIPF